MLELFRVTLIGCIALTMLLLVLIALPQSKLRDALRPFFYWGFALLCVAYVGSPVDFVPEIVAGPFGLVDDAGAIVAGIAAVRAALRERKERQAA